METDTFIKQLPKVELHAHLNGSLSNKTLDDLYRLKNGGSGPPNNSEFYKIIGNQSISLTDCFKKFKYAHDLTDTKEALQFATKSVIEDFQNDNVMYLELRTTPRSTTTMSKNDYLSTVVETIRECNLIHSIQVKLIPSIDRSQGIESAEENLAIILKLKETNDDLIVGIDLSGDPTKSNFDLYKPVLQKARAAGLKLAIHCGEVQNDDEVMAMIEFGIDRIGHGTFIGDGKAFDLVLSQKIPIECCLTSNVKCGTVKSYEDHHFKKFFELNHEIVICTDDFGVFETTLSNELDICQKTFELTNSDIVRLTKNAIRCSFANEQEKGRLMKYLTDELVEETQV